MDVKKLLIVVDYQNDFVDGSLGFEAAKSLEGHILKLIKEYEETGNDIIFTLDTHQDDYFETVEGKKLPVKHTIEGTKGHEIYGEVGKLALKHITFKKDTFGSSVLLRYLQKMKKPYQEITLVGLVSHICVTANAIICKTALPNAKIIVDTNGSASFDKQAEEAAYTTLKNLHIEVI